MPANIRVYLDVTIGNKVGGRIVFELFNDVAPKAVENFRGLCTGEYGNAKNSGLPLSYKNCKFFKCVPGFLVQSGDFEYNNGEGGESIYGGTFKAESFLRRHAQAGVLSMANNGSRHANGSQFLITLKQAHQLDHKHVAFGQIVDGIEVLRAIEKCPVDSNGRPRVPIVITDCGELPKLPPKRRNDPKTQMRDSVTALMSSMEAVEGEELVGRPPADSRLRAAAPRVPRIFQEARQEALAGATGKTEKRGKSAERIASSEKEDRAPSAEPKQKRRRIIEDDSNQGQLFEQSLDMQDERQKKLYYLRMQLNQSKKLNAKEVSLKWKNFDVVRSFCVCL